LHHLIDNAITLPDEIKEDIKKIFSWELEQITIPYIAVCKIDSFLVDEFNNWERIEFWSDKNGWDIDWWYYFPIWNEDETEKKVICVSWGAWNSSMITIYRTDEAIESESY
jgi:hypothetical protein